MFFHLLAGNSLSLDLLVSEHNTLWLMLNDITAKARLHDNSVKLVSFPERNILDIDFFKNNSKIPKQ